MIRSALAGLMLGAALAGVATADVSEMTAEAARQLAAAESALAEARGARNRVTALTTTVQAYEAGLAALREAMRQAVRRERVLTASLEAGRADTARILAALAAMGPDPAAPLLLHPEGPVAAARAGILLAEITPPLQQRVQGLRAAHDEIADLQRAQFDAEAALAEGLRGAQQARADLGEALAARSDLPRRFEADPARIRALLDASSTLADFATRLAALDLPAPEGATFSAQRGALPLPVRGSLQRGFDEADAAGVRRPGWLIATAPGALVTAPVEATVRYAGPLPGYANVMILEPESGILLVLAGLDRVYGHEGRIVGAGEALGLMGGTTGGAPPGAEKQESGGARRGETLYMELRRNERPVDPAGWFAAMAER